MIWLLVWVFLFLVSGLWSSVYGFWFMFSGLWFLVSCLNVLEAVDLSRSAQQEWCWRLLGDGRVGPIPIDKQEGECPLLRKRGVAPLRPDCGGSLCAQPSGWCIDTLRSHLVADHRSKGVGGVSLLGKQGYAPLLQRCYAPLRPPTTVGVVFLLSLRTGALTLCGSIL